MKKKLDKINKIHTPYVWANPKKCVACWACVDACPEQVIGRVGFLWHKHIVFKNSESCISCKKCIKTCPHGVFSDNLPDALRSVLLKKGIGF
jgi:2-oxoglutarate ferredoxin oxidoreductase subunit delta